jgi:predicted amidophosphoribosyltransferase
MDLFTPALGAPVTADITDADAGTPRARDPDLAAATDHPARHRDRHVLPLLRLLEALHLAWIELLALLAPVECLCCGREDTELCSACARRIRDLCSRPFRAESQAPALLTVDGAVLVPVVAVGPYREELAQAVLSFKRLGQRNLALLLGRMLERGLRAAVGEGRRICLVPVPTSAAAFRRRGFSPVHLLLRRVRRRAGSQWLLCEALRKRQSGPFTRAVSLRREVQGMPLPGFLAAGMDRFGRSGVRRMGSAGQKGLDRGDRARRVRGSMVVSASRRSSVSGKPCIIVDDVLTTGATIAEAARAVEAAGGLVCGAVVLAATRSPGRTDLDAGTAAVPSYDSNQIKSVEGVN